jgi:hypothetical protein
VIATLAVADEVRRRCAEQDEIADPVLAFLEANVRR